MAFNQCDGTPSPTTFFFVFTVQVIQQNWACHIWLLRWSPLHGNTWVAMFKKPEAKSNSLRPIGWATFRQWDDMVKIGQIVGGRFPQQLNPHPKLMFCWLRYTQVWNLYWLGWHLWTFAYDVKANRIDAWYHWQKPCSISILKSPKSFNPLNHNRHVLWLWGCRNWCRRMWKRPGPVGISAKLATAFWEAIHSAQAAISSSTSSSSVLSGSIACPTVLQLLVACSTVILVQPQLEPTMVEFPWMMDSNHRWVWVPERRILCTVVYAAQEHGHQYVFFF